MQTTHTTLHRLKSFISSTVATSTINLYSFCILFGQTPGLGKKKTSLATLHFCCTHSHGSAYFPACKDLKNCPDWVALDPGAPGWPVPPDARPCRKPAGFGLLRAIRGDSFCQGCFPECHSSPAERVTTSNARVSVSCTPCSSEQSAKAKTQKELFKTLKELKMNLPPEKRSKGKSSTINTLKYALRCVKQVKGKRRLARLPLPSRGKSP